ncbi:hypothetical protein [Brevibacillus sp. MCWH]|uniref:hypothetical protein n=1 Tax=Brevibacillus sp. MCWH TaxID=2508871 RepID=UPI000E38C11A|nr:hypothetical protein [Brevibacillus sp. MCWH]NNV01830.1 hypothetical protein [Brevibacillus sp. MCWH]REK64186.1 MAG: hypothetical protein DF221_08780 [Brevibacillus sp.]
MSLKAVEWQVSVPRSPEIGRIQEHDQQRTVYQQQWQTDDRKLTDQQMRQRPTDVNETEKNMIREREQQQKRKKQADSGAELNEAKDGTDQGSTSDGVLMRDPLRGRFIDISL